MELIPVAIGFSELAQPGELTTGLAIMIVGILALLAIVGVRLRSTISMAVWMFTVLSLVFSILVGTDFVFFWVTVAINCIAVTLSMVVFATYGSQV